MKEFLKNLFNLSYFQRYKIIFIYRITFMNEQKTDVAKTKIFLYSLGFLILGSFFYNLGLYPILDVNEGLYAEIAREMLVGKNYIVPILNNVLYLEKPPLLYWLTMLSYKCFGINAMSARLIPALSATAISGILLLFGYVARRILVGIVAGIIFASSLFIAIMARVVIFDMLLTAMISASLLMFFIWYKHNYNNNRRDFALKYLLLSYACLGLVFLTKGVIGLCICAGSILLFFLLHKSKIQQYGKLFNIYAIGVFLIVVSPWLVAMACEVPNFLQHFFINEQLLRFLNQRVPHDYHEGSWYFYLPRIVIYLFPWSLCIPDLLWKLREKIGQQDILHLFLWSWVIFPLLLFSFSGEKGDCYMLVSMPAMAMLLAEHIVDWINKKNYKPLNVLFYCVTIALVFVLGFFATNPEKYVEIGTNKLILYTCLFLSVYGIFGWVCIRKYRNFCWSFLFLAGLSMPLINFYIQLKHITQHDFSQITLAKYIQQNNLNNVSSVTAKSSTNVVSNNEFKNEFNNEFYLFRDYEELSSLIFLLQQPIKIIDSASRDLFYGQSEVYKQSDKMFVSKDSFMHKLLALTQIKQLKQEQETHENNNIRNFTNTNLYVIVAKKRLNEFQNMIAEQKKIVTFSIVNVAESGDGLLFKYSNFQFCNVLSKS